MKFDAFFDAIEFYVDVCILEMLFTFTDSP